MSLKNKLLDLDISGLSGTVQVDLYHLIPDNLVATCLASDHSVTNDIYDPPFQGILLNHLRKASCFLFDEDLVHAIPELAQIEGFPNGMKDFVHPIGIFGNSFF
jgi:hypothetical protein